MDKTVVLADGSTTTIREVAERLVEVTQGRFPEHPHMPVAAMEAAIEVVGMRIAGLSADLYAERRSAQRDETRVEALLSQISELRELQDSLTPEDTDRVQAILSGQTPR